MIWTIQYVETIWISHDFYVDAYKWSKFVTLWFEGGE